MAVWLEKAKEGESGAMILSPGTGCFRTALAPLQYEAVTSNAIMMLFFGKDKN